MFKHIKNWQNWQEFDDVINAILFNSVKRNCLRKLFIDHKANSQSTTVKTGFLLEKSLGGGGGRKTINHCF